MGHRRCRFKRELNSDEHLERLDEAFPKWTCECKRAYVSIDPDDACEKPYTCPTCGRVYDGDPWYWTSSCSDGRLRYEHDCWPHWYDRRTDDPSCVLCGSKIIDPYEYWQCSCKAARNTLSQSDVISSPLLCDECGRVWDGRNWFKSVEWYNVIVIWENLWHEADALLKRGERPDSEKEKWALELMGFCDTHTNMDVTVFWKLDRLLDANRPLADADRSAIEAALRDCGPIMELLWHRGESFPYRPEEWENLDDNAPGGTREFVRIRQPRLNSDSVPLRPQQREIVEAIREAGTRLTQAELLSAIAKKGPSRSMGWLKNIMPTLVQLQVVTKGSDSHGSGYGLPEWNGSIEQNGHADQDKSRDQSRD